MAEDSAKGPAGGAPPPGTRVLDHGRRQFLIASRRGTQALVAGLRPMSASAVRTVVAQLPSVEVMRVLQLRRPLSGRVRGR